MEAEKSKKTSSMYYTAMDVQEMLGISKGMAYKILRKLNAELAAKNYIVIPGKYHEHISQSITMECQIKLYYAGS